jgi:hypothetical protein
MMKTAAFAIALLMSSAAFAQTSTQPDVDVDSEVAVQPGDVAAEASVDAKDGAADAGLAADTTTSAASDSATAALTPASAQLIQPGNTSPERDARGIAVISSPAMVPAGWNGVSGSSMGGPMLDPSTGEAIDTADASYPACSASITDKCLQTYERGRSHS